MNPTTPANCTSCSRTFTPKPPPTRTTTPTSSASPTSTASLSSSNGSHTVVAPPLKSSSTTPGSATTTCAPGSRRPAHTLHGDAWIMNCTRREPPLEHRTTLIYDEASAVSLHKIIRHTLALVTEELNRATTESRLLQQRSTKSALLPVFWRHSAVEWVVNADVTSWLHALSAYSPALSALIARRITLISVAPRISITGF